MGLWLEEVVEVWLEGVVRVEVVGGCDWRD